MQKQQYKLNANVKNKLFAVEVSKKCKQDRKMRLKQCKLILFSNLK